MLENAFFNVYTKFKMHFYQQVFKRMGEKESGLTTVECFCLESIAALGKPTIAEFAHFMNISTPNAAYKVNSLVAKGYVKRKQSKKDRREYHLEITEKYKDYNSVSYSYLGKVLERVKDRFSSEELAKLTELLFAVETELMPEIQPKKTV